MFGEVGAVLRDIICGDGHIFGETRIVSRLSHHGYIASEYERMFEQLGSYLSGEGEIGIDFTTGENRMSTPVLFNFPVGALDNLN